MIELERYQYQLAIENLQKQVSLLEQLVKLHEQDIARRDAVIDAQQKLLAESQRLMDLYQARIDAFTGSVGSPAHSIALVLAVESVQMIPVKDYIKMKISDASVPREGIMHVMLNRWWMTDGENILFYRSYSYPQCNHNKR
jgi:hypothetical protein